MPEICKLTCSDCGQDFTFTAADQTFFQETGYSTPKRCKIAVRQRRTMRGLRHLRARHREHLYLSGLRQPTTVPFEPVATARSIADCYQARKAAAAALRAQPLTRFERSASQVAPRPV